jgi:two-component system nitrogen regulation response regulator GlnG
MTQPKILVVDDDESIAWVIRRSLEKRDYRVQTAASGEEALALTQEADFPLAIVDVRLPGISGLELLAALRKKNPSIKVIVITAQSTMKNAVAAMQQGAFDYLTKPLDLKELQALVDKAAQLGATGRSPLLPHPPPPVKEQTQEIIGRSEVMQNIYKAIGRVAQSDATVLILGESGTGKELVAQALHRHSRRASGPFIAINCTALPKDLLESELFGHERGAFTGAVEQRVGKFELARGGTLFLDEIGDIALELQAKLLRVLQTKEFNRLGSNKLIQTDARIIAATNHDLARLVAEGSFRQDLYFRINVVPIYLPPLRERPQDIPLLARHFQEKFCREMGLGISGISATAMDFLQSYPWPGNVRELENALRRALLFCQGNKLEREDFGFLEERKETNKLESVSHHDFQQLIKTRFRELLSASDQNSGHIYDLMHKEMEEVLIDLALRHTGGRRQKAAELLGINRNTLRYKAEKKNNAEE